ncbi:uncharacterized protein LOC142534411 [Primulina tabacum]|uniref:uncharacterized protein LOC142534411 n=1 Tax=Primulina tabacum TaxID=48773 RepID=UPI003F59A344
MATASDSSASVQSVNSVIDRHSRLASPCSCSSISDQKHFLAEDGQAEGSENVGVTKKCVWNNPANGVAPQVGALMGTASWPDFSKSGSSVVEASPFKPVKSSISSGVSPRDNTRWDVGQRGGSHSGHEPHHPRGPFRRNNSGPQLQGNGSSNHGHGSKRYQDVGLMIGAITINLLAAECFIFTYFALGPHPGSPGHMPMFPYAPMSSPIPDPHLPSKIGETDRLLFLDTYLRQKMDVDGWVPINLIANFKKIRELTDNVQLILDALRASNVVEIQGEKVRRKGNWRKWIMPTFLYST